MDFDIQMQDKPYRYMDAITNASAIAEIKIKMYTNLRNEMFEYFKTNIPLQFSDLSNVFVNENSGVINIELINRLSPQQVFEYKNRIKQIYSNFVSINLETLRNIFLTKIIQACYEILLVLQNEPGLFINIDYISSSDKAYLVINFL